MKDALMVIPFVLIGLILGCLLVMEISIKEIDKVEKENKELKTQNERLEKIVKELDREQAEHTKRTAEKNGDKLEFITDKITIQKLMICVKRRDNLSKETMFKVVGQPIKINEIEDFRYMEVDFAAGIF